MKSMQSATDINAIGKIKCVYNFSNTLQATIDANEIYDSEKKTTLKQHYATRQIQ